MSYQDNPPNPIGEAVIAPVGASVSAGYLVEEMTSKQAADKAYLVFSSANYSLQNVPATLSIVNGVYYNLFIDPTMDGIVVVKNGRPEILSSREVDLIQAANNALSSKGTVFQVNLLVHNGKNIVPESSSNSCDVRRVLVTFNDGSYGIIHFSEYIDLFELGKILEKIPDIKEAVNFDTGGSNVGGYHTTGWNLNFFSDVDPDASSATIFYIR